MAFTTRRGRPPTPKPDAQDYGTPETQLKRAFGVTQEPIDQCFERSLISARQHWCGLHLRWLYTLRYSAPIVTTRYTDRHTASTPVTDSEDWRELREKEYHVAAEKLRQSQRYEPVMRLCVYNELPAFLNPIFLKRAWDEPALAARLHTSRHRILEGLDILETLWKKPPASDKFRGHNSTI